MGYQQTMKIGVFSKFSFSGGSEFRCAELASGIARYTNDESFLLCEGNLPQRVLERVDEGVFLRTQVLKDQSNVNILYDMDAIIVVNSDGKLFTDLEYWRGKTDRHNCLVDLSKIKAFIFLFNFIVSPSIKLTSLLEEVHNIKIITTNSRFFNEMSIQDRYKEVRHLPRLMLESPINPSSVSTEKKLSDRIRIGQYSIGMEQKFNEEIAQLLTRINSKYYEKVWWDFMGIPLSRANLIMQSPNVTIRKAFAKPVKEFLKETDLFLFYPSWKRQEPWSRSVGEALASGCPVLATDKGGNRDQIIHGNNGYLCSSLDDFVQYLSGLIEEPELILALGRNAVLYSRFFSTEYVVKKLMEFIR
jgi:hypothetical protein